MSKSCPDDDFFGIEYVSSSSSVQHHNEQQRSSDSTASSQEPIGVEKLKKIVKDSQHDQLPGSVFVDSTYFPELVDPSISKETADQDGELEPSVFDRTYFGQITDRKDGKQLEKLELRESDQFYEDLGRHSRKESVSRKENSRPVRASDQFYEDIGRQMEDNEVNTRQKSRRTRNTTEVEESLSHSNEKAMPFKQNTEEMDNYVADLLAQNVIYQSHNLIAINKPFNLPYSGNIKGYQIDRSLQKLKFRIASKVERLHLVRSLDKDLSGVLLFATSKLAQTEAKELVKEGKLIHRCISYGELKEPVEINTPLIKVIKESRNVKMFPLTNNKTTKPIHYGTTLITPRKSNDKYVYLTATTTNELHHQLRCHLSLANVPLHGDTKYGKAHILLDRKVLPPRDAQNNGEDWDIFDYRSLRKAPLFSHLMEMRLPNPDMLKQQEIVIKAPLPRFFIYALKKLKIFVR